MNWLAAPSTSRTRIRGWLRFSLRMLFLLTLAVAVALGVMMKRLRDRKAAVVAINSAGGTMGLRIAGPKWLRTIINDDQCFYDPIRVSLGPIARQKGQDVPTLDDASLARLGGVLKSFKRLEVLDIRGSAVSDRSAAVLTSLETVAHLRISDTQIANETIREISRLRYLQSLELRGTAITDECVDDLCGLGALTSLDIAKTQISADGVSRLKQQLPSCKITN